MRAMTLKKFNLFPTNLIWVDDAKDARHNIQIERARIALGHQIEYAGCCLN